MQSSEQRAVRAGTSVTDEQRAGASQARGYRNVVLGFLVLAYTLNFIDRSIVGIIGQAIKVDLLLTDAQLGLLGGLAFALLYTSVGLPIARVAERSNRVNLISIAIVIWSGFTALCGLAQSFVQLLLFRAGVGIGEAGLSPAAHSLISDYFEPRRRASALAVYGLGIPIGAMIGTVAGGWIAQNLDWRWAFMLVGLPGILVALSLRMFVKEPRRNAEAVRGVSVRYEAAELWGTIKTLLGRWPTANVVLGVTVLSFADYGIGTFAAPYFVREFGLGLATVGLFLGVVVGVSSAAGTLLGGFFSDWLSKRSFSAYAFVPAIGIVVAGPIYMLAYTQDDWHWAIGLIVLPAILGSLVSRAEFRRDSEHGRRSSASDRNGGAAVHRQSDRSRCRSAVRRMDHRPTGCLAFHERAIARRRARRDRRVLAFNGSGVRGELSRRCRARGRRRRSHREMCARIRNRYASRHPRDAALLLLGRAAFLPGVDRPGEVDASVAQALMRVMVGS